MAALGRPIQFPKNTFEVKRQAGMREEREKVCAHDAWRS